LIGSGGKQLKGWGDVWIHWSVFVNHNGGGTWIVVYAGFWHTTGCGAVAQDASNRDRLKSSGLDLLNLLRMLILCGLHDFIVNGLLFSDGGLFDGNLFFDTVFLLDVIVMQPRKKAAAAQHSQNY
jgi:hypothetical protein